MPAKLGEKRWYIVTTYSTHEAKTADNLRKRIESMKMQDEILRVLVAETETEVVSIKDGKEVRKIKKENLYPGYIFVEMIMTDESWYIVRNTPGVTGIAGSSGGGQKPTPVSREAIEPVLKRMNLVDESMYDRYNIGDRIRVIDGPYQGNEGEILMLDKQTGNCTVNLMFFGRYTPVDLDFSKIERI